MQKAAREWIRAMISAGVFALLVASIGYFCEKQSLQHATTLGLAIFGVGTIGNFLFYLRSTVKRRPVK
jgi:hypothetical protein